MDIAESVKALTEAGAVSIYTVDLNKLPENFRPIGVQGCTRTPLLSGEWVFKVGSASVNETEVSKSEEMRNDPDLPSWCYVPEAVLVDGICVQEYVPNVRPMQACAYDGCYCGLSPCWAERAEELELRYGLTDLHHENVCAFGEGDDYVLVVFDLGCGFSDDDGF